MVVMEKSKLEAIERATSIVVFGGKWFDKVNGNTYNRPKLITNNGDIIYLNYEYGYGRDYFYRAETTIMKINPKCKVIDGGCANYKQRDLKNNNF